MGVWNCVVIFGLLSTVTAVRDFVPVLIWGNRELYDSKSVVSGLSKLDTDDFFNYMLRKVKEDKTNIVAFIEENLSLEDFSWTDVNEQGAFPLLANITASADDSAFLPSVRNPYKALKKLVAHGFTWKNYNSDDGAQLKDGENTVLLVKLTEPDSSEGRPELLRSHDMEISKIYNNILMSTSNVLALYTGNHSSWIDADVKFTRIRRSVSEESFSDDYSSSDSVLLTDNNRTVLIYVQRPILYQDGPESVNLSETTITPTVEKMKGAIALDVNFKFKNETPQIDFYFNGLESGNWNLTHIVVNEKKDQVLVPSMAIEAPKGYSFYCGKGVIFSDKENQITLALNNFQVQPYVKDGKFGPAIDCVPYFSIAIWSGLFIVLLLTLVLAWGIMMIMDINTMDRFDDAKGKTITISATE